MNTADAIIWSIINEDSSHPALKGHMNRVYSTSDDYWNLVVYDDEGDELIEFERDGWNPKPQSEVPYKTANAVIPFHYYENITFINITFTITEGTQ
jgi:hypothetical protein